MDCEILPTSFDACEIAPTDTQSFREFFLCEAVARSHLGDSTADVPQYQVRILATHGANQAAPSDTKTCPSTCPLLNGYGLGP